MTEARVTDEGVRLQPDTGEPTAALTTAAAAGLPAAKPPVAYDPDDPASLYMVAGVFEQLQRVAKMMTSAGLVPAHLRGPDHVADCFLIAAQAFRWRIDPFAVAQHTFVVSGKLGYEGKLIAAVVNTHKKVDPDHTLKPVYSGVGKDRKIVLSARLRSEREDRTIEGTVEQWATDNPKWKSMTDQMLFYRGAREWARRHLPEAIVGIDAEEPGPTVTLTPQRDGSFAAPPADARPDPLLAPPAPAPAAPGPAAATAEAHPADAPDAEREPPTIVHPPVTPPPAPEPAKSDSPFGKALEQENARREGRQRRLTEQ